MKTWCLEKAKIYNDGSLGLWEISKVDGVAEVWYNSQDALDAAFIRDTSERDGCQWRVADHERG